MAARKKKLYKISFRPKGTKRLKAIYVVKLQISFVKLQLKVIIVLALMASFRPFGVFGVIKVGHSFFSAFWHFFLQVPQAK